MNLVLFDDPLLRVNLMPFTLTRPVGDIRVGILTIREKWEKRLSLAGSFYTQDYLSGKFPLKKASDNLLINGAVCPDQKIVAAVQNLKKGEALAKGTFLIAAHSDDAAAGASQLKAKEYTDDLIIIDQVWKIFQHNGTQIRLDFELVTAHRDSERINDPHSSLYAVENIFVDEGASVKASILNAENGPIYIGKNAQVQEGSAIRGPFSLGENSIVNMGAKIKGDATVGPHCKVGGEISNAVLFGYSNKAHDGFLGSSVIGEWCNLGADTNTSNLKNNYDEVKLWNYSKKGFVKTGLTFCGLIMGDHSKCGINTMFNTGSVTGVSANIFGGGYPRNFIPSFSWGGSSGFITFDLEKAYDTAQKAMARRNATLSDEDKKILKAVFDSSTSERVWEKS